MAYMAPVARFSFRELTLDDYRALRLVSEQRAMPLDQLQEFLGISLERVQEITWTLCLAGLLERRSFLVREEPWVWLSGIGRQFFGLGEEPFVFGVGVSQLEHFRAVNEVRFKVEKESAGRWLEPREAAKLTGGRASFRPDGVLMVGEESHAFKVEVTPKSMARLREIIKEQCKRFDYVVYVCSPTVRRLLDRMPDVLTHENLLLGKLPKDTTRYLTDPKFRLDGDEDPKGREIISDPDDREYLAINLLAEQGAIPLDQLARFWQCDIEEARLFVDQLYEEAYVLRAQPLVDEPMWVWVSNSAARRYCKADLNAPPPRLGGLEVLRASNEARLRMIEKMAGSPDMARSRWFGRRELMNVYEAHMVLPNAVYKVGDELHGVEIEYGSVTKDRRVEVYGQRAEEFKSVTVFCRPRAREGLEELVEEEGWANVSVEELPASKGQQVDNPRVARRDVYNRLMPVPLTDIPEDVVAALCEKAGFKEVPPITAAQRRLTTYRWRFEIGDEVWQVTRKKRKEEGWIAWPQRPWKEIPQSDVPREALDALTETVGYLPGILKSEKPTGKGPGVYRLRTEAGVFRVTNTKWGWKAYEVGEYEFIDSIVSPKRKI